MEKNNKGIVAGVAHEQAEYNPQNHPDEFLKRNGSVFSEGLKRSGSILSKNE